MSSQVMGYTNWDGGEPNDAGDGEDCAEGNWNGDSWNDIGCNDDHPGICEYQDGTYDTTSSMDFSAARDECQSRGGHLVVINSASENDYIYNNFGNAWIGYYQPPGSSEPAGGWTWVETNEPPIINPDGNTDDDPSPAEVTGTSPSNGPDPTLSVDVSDPNDEPLNVDFYRDASSWNTVLSESFSGGTSGWSSETGNLETRTSSDGDQWLAPQCTTAVQTNRISETIDDGGITYDRVRYDVEVGALDSWDNEYLRLQLKTDGSWTTVESRTPHYGGSEAFPDMQCYNDFDSPGRYSFTGEVSTNDISGVRVITGLDQDDDDESVAINDVNIEVRRTKTLIGTDGSVDGAGDVATQDWNGLTCGASYDWFVKAIEEDGEASTTSNIWNFDVDCNEPPQISIVEPAESTDTGLVTSTSPQLRVSVSDPDDSSLDVTFYDNDGNVIETKNDVYSDVNAEWTGLTKGNQYSWSAEVCDDGGECDTSSKATFTVNTPPEEPESPNPSDGVEGIDHNSVTLSSYVEDQDGDNMQVTFSGDSGTDSFSKSTDVSGSGTASVSVTGLQPGTQYDWDVTVEDEHGASTTGETWSFTTNYLPAIRNPQPQNGGFISSDSVDLSVDVSDDDGDMTNVRIYDDSGAQIGSGSTSDGSEVTVDADYTGLTYGETYDWTVEAEDAYGTNSKTFSFNVIGGGSFRTESGIDYEYSSVVKSGSQTRFIEYEVSNNNVGDKELETGISGPEASFSQYSGDTHTYTLGGGETKTFRIQITESQPGDYDLQVVTENQELGIQNTDTIPVLVREYPASGVERVPGIGMLHVVILIASGLVITVFGSV